MNIFILDYNIKDCARDHVDKHIVKMPTESSQLLSTAVRLSGIDAGYQITHKNHPCSVWVRESLDNFLWLRELSYYLNKEWQFRYGHTRNHKGFEVGWNLPIPNLPKIGLTPFAQALPKELKNIDTVTAYRNYYIRDKKHLANWRKRDVPFWWKNE